MKLGMQVGLDPSNIVLDGDQARPPPKRGRESSPQIFGPYLLWPNGCMDQDETWHAGGPRFRPHCYRCGTHPSSSHKGAEPPNFRPISVVTKWLLGLRWHLLHR